ncbi:MAG: DUF4340 domain-containing protein [Reichenbachiella sp.]|uniref:DUF4340 domain-containing protein n=1 Tax=Reichenbachiella sp. TaxID=2184521 RepID=UPI0032672770
MKRISNIKLIGILAILSALYFVIDFTGSRKRSKTLKSELVEIDTAKVSKILVESNTGSKVELEKIGGEWELALNDGKRVVASSSAVDNALYALLSIKPARMATRSKDKWKDYQVDSTGTRVRVFEGASTTLDLIIGRFGMEGQRAYHTFVRLFEDDEVYVAKDFMGFSVSSDPSAYRDQVLARIKKDSISNITFNYPADSSFRIERVGAQWQSNGSPLDSASVVKYLNGLNYISGKSFMDQASELASPVMSAAIDMNDGQTILFDAYQYEGQWVVHSTDNEEGYFTDENLIDKIFIGRSEL